MFTYFLELQHRDLLARQQDLSHHLASDPATSSGKHEVALLTIDDLALHHDTRSQPLPSLSFQTPFRTIPAFFLLATPRHLAMQERQPPAGPPTWSQDWNMSRCSRHLAERVWKHSKGVRFPNEGRLLYTRLAKAVNARAHSHAGARVHAATSWTESCSGAHPTKRKLKL